MAATTMYRSCSSHALVWSSAAGFPSFSRMYKEGGRGGRSRSETMGDGQVNRMSCICTVWSSAHQSHLMVSTSLKSRRRGAASVAPLTCARLPAVWANKHPSTREANWQYIMGLLYKKDEFLDRYVCVQDNKGQLAMFQTTSKQGNVLSLCHHTSTVHYINTGRYQQKNQVLGPGSCWWSSNQMCIRNNMRKVVLLFSSHLRKHQQELYDVTKLKFTKWVKNIDLFICTEPPKR